MIRIDKLVTLIYVVLGAAAGYLSNLVNNIYIAALISLAIFISSQYYFLKKLNPQKKNRFVVENFVTFALIWLVVWIFFFNTR